MVTNFPKILAGSGSGSTQPPSTETPCPPTRESEPELDPPGLL